MSRSEYNKHTGYSGSRTKRVTYLRDLAAVGGLLVLMVLAAVAVSGRAESAVPPVQVLVSNFAFDPPTLTINAGTTVTWVNQDEEPHTATSADGKFASPALDTDQSFSFRFDAPGTYAYFCAVHPHMRGTIVVR
jgi:plastocyanin